MRVLMTADTIGGVWTYAMDLCRALGPLGVEVALATMGEPLNQRQRLEMKQLRHVQVYESVYRLEWMDEPWADVRDAGLWLMGIRKRFRPEIVHLNGFAHGSLDWNCPLLVAAHSCVLSWWEAVKGEAAPANYLNYRRRVSEGIRSADLVVAPSQAMLDATRKHYGPLRRGATVIYNGRDPSLYAPASKNQFVLSAGRLWDEGKNLSILEAAAPHIRWPVHVAGAVQDPAGRRIESRNVRASGPVSSDQLARLCAHASIYAAPVKYEPFGLGILEAAFCGCALVLGDIASLREIWGDAAEYVDPADAASVTQGINLLIADDARRLALAKAAHARAQRYLPKRMALEYHGAYQALLGRAGPSSVLPRSHAQTRAASSN